MSCLLPVLVVGIVVSGQLTLVQLPLVTVRSTGHLQLWLALSHHWDVYIFLGLWGLLGPVVCLLATVLVD